MKVITVLSHSVVCVRVERDRYVVDFGRHGPVPPFSEILIAIHNRYTCTIAADAAKQGETRISGGLFKQDHKNSLVD